MKGSGNLLALRISPALLAQFICCKETFIEKLFSNFRYVFLNVRYFFELGDFTTSYNPKTFGLEIFFKSFEYEISFEFGFLSSKMNKIKEDFVHL